MSDKSSYFEARNVGITSRNIEWRFESTRANECSVASPVYDEIVTETGAATCSAGATGQCPCVPQGRRRNWTMSLRSTGLFLRFEVLCFLRFEGRDLAEGACTRIQIKFLNV